MSTAAFPTLIFFTNSPIILHHTRSQVDEGDNRSHEWFIRQIIILGHTCHTSAWLLWSLSHRSWTSSEFVGRTGVNSVYTPVTCLACINHSREYNKERLDVSTDTVDSFDLCHIYRQSVGNGKVDNKRLISLPFSREGTYPQVTFVKYTDMRRITTFRSTTDRIYDGGPIRL